MKNIFVRETIKDKVFLIRNNNFIHHLLTLLLSSVLVIFTGNMWAEVFESVKNKYAKEHLIITIIFILFLLVFLVFLRVLYIIFIQRKISHYMEIVSKSSPYKKIHAAKNLKNKDVILKRFLKHKLFFTDPQIKKIHKFFTQISFYRENKWNTAVLFAGDSGLGKTEVARKICELNGGGYLVNLSTLLSMKKPGINLLYKIIYDCQKNKKILILDDGDIGLVNRILIEKIKYSPQSPKAKEDMMILEDAVNILLHTLSTGLVTIIFTINLINSLDTAYSRRFPIYLYFSAPNEEQLIGIYNNHLKVEFSDINFIEGLKLLAENSHGLSGRDIKNIAINVKRRALFHNNVSISMVLEYVLSLQKKIKNRSDRNLYNKHIEWINGKSKN